MLKKTKNLIGLLALQIAAMAAPVITFAQTSIPPGPIVPEKIKPIDNILKVVQTIIQFILLVAFVIAFIMLLVGGIRWILAGGDEKAVAGARNTITAALIGLVIVLVAFAIIKLVEAFFGIQIISGNVCIPSITTPCP